MYRCSVLIFNQPLTPSGHTQASVYAFAEVASAMIAKDHK